MQLVKKRLIFESPEGLYLSHHGYYPIGEESSFPNLDLKKISEDISWNDDTAPNQGSNCWKYMIVEVEIPDFMSVEQYCSQFLKIYHFLTMFKPYFDRLSDRQIKNAYSLYCSYNSACILIFHDLLRVKNMRSIFRASILDQILNWLEEDQHKYDYPLSKNQQQHFMYPDFERGVRTFNSSSIRFFPDNWNKTKEMA